MREIKFRGRCSVTKKWVYGHYADVGDGLGGVVSSIFQSGNYNGTPIDVETVAQYTGLKDKNGVEIYEGDILDGSYSNPLTKKDVKKYFQVVYENGCYNAHAKNHPFGSTVLYFVNTKSKVIGNIYENPELLEDADD